jgi:hypothetical protein
LLFREEGTIPPVIGDVLTRSDTLLVSCEGGAYVLLFVEVLLNHLLE